ncbi:Uncharacterised protein [Mycobacteroides abscessus subsp. abscessus]|nr:Uncharacterised protein [Mycobacteroides abscessus subsp. abscessus]
MFDSSAPIWVRRLATMLDKRCRSSIACGMTGGNPSSCLPKVPIEAAIWSVSVSPNVVVTSASVSCRS